MYVSMVLVKEMIKLFSDQILVFCLRTAVWCSGFIYASHAADRGSIPGCVKSASNQTASGTA